MFDQWSARARSDLGCRRFGFRETCEGFQGETPATEDIEQLHREPEWNSGRNARTLVKYDDFRVVLTALKNRARLLSHQTEGRISIQTITGHLQVRAQGRTFDLPTGTLLALDQALPHDVEALEESAFLLTIAWPVRDEQD